MKQVGWVTSAVTSVVVVFLLLGAARAPAQEAEPDPVEEAGCNRFAEYDPNNFADTSNRITRTYFTLRPGEQRVYEGRSNVTGSVLPHRVTFTVTRLTKMVDGVRTRVMWDVDESDDRLAETELAVFAQDRDRNVWNLGEYPEEYPGGVFIGAPSTWFVGHEDAEPGIHMPIPRSPRRTPEYLQGYVPSIEFFDCAKIVDDKARVCVPVGCFDNVLVIHERSPFDPEGGVQVKYHAPGVGIVSIGALDDPEGETLVLTQYKRLSHAELAAANREARILDQRGRQCNELYAQTEPLEGPNDGDFGPYTCPVPPPPPPAVPTAPAGFAFPWTTPPPPAAGTPPAQAATRRSYAARVDHPLFPLRRLRTMRHEGREDGRRVRVESRVRSRPVHIVGVRTTAVESREFEDGELVERLTAFYAQDRAGNVWQLGERIDDIEGGRVVGHDGQWMAGQDGARRGLFLPADPRRGQRFLSARAPSAVVARSTVVATAASVATPAGRFTGCLRRRDRERGRGAGVETKVFCPGVGLVREKPARGVIELVRYRRR